jgi:hypothetical protein
MGFLEGQGFLEAPIVPVIATGTMGTWARIAKRAVRVCLRSSSRLAASSFRGDTNGFSLFKRLDRQAESAEVGMIAVQPYSVAVVMNQRRSGCLSIWS